MRTRRIRGLPRQDTPPQEAPIPAAQTFAPSVYDAWTASAARDTNHKSTRDFLACIHVFIDGLEDSYIKANLRIGLQNYPGLRPPVVTRSPDDPSANQIARPPQQGMTERAEDFNTRRTIDEIRALMNHHGLRFGNLNEAIAIVEQRVRVIDRTVTALKYGLFVAVFAVAMSLTFVWRHWHLP